MSADETTKCPLCMGSGKDPDLEHMEDSLFGPVEVSDYCRMCEGEKVVSSEGVWLFVERLYRSEVAS